MRLFLMFPSSSWNDLDTILKYDKNDYNWCRELGALPLREGGGAKHSPPGSTGSIDNALGGI